MSERTLIIIKPDAVQRHLIGCVISRFENKGLKLVAAKFQHISESLAREHYADHKEKPFFGAAVKFLSSSPSLVMVWQGTGAIEMARKLMGSTFGFNAQPGTIRGDFGASVRYNLVHGSDSIESAEKEIARFFGADEIVDYEQVDDAWVYVR